MSVTTIYDWRGQSQREATAILAELGMTATAATSYETLVGLLAAAWLKGADAGAEAVQRMLEELADELEGGTDDPAA